MQATFVRDLVALGEHLLPAEFKPRARYYPPMDMILYLNSDESYTAERVDPYLTLLWGGDEGRDLVGVKLKGFRYLFLRIQKRYPRLTEEKFLPFLALFEEILTDGLAEEIIEANRDKYTAAKRLILVENLDMEELQKAA